MIFLDREYSLIFPITQSINGILETLGPIFSVYQIIGNNGVSDWMFISVLTGWIPECIHLRGWGSGKLFQLTRGWKYILGVILYLKLHGGGFIGNSMKARRLLSPRVATDTKELNRRLSRDSRYRFPSRRRFGRPGCRQPFPAKKASEGALLCCTRWEVARCEYREGLRAID